MQDGQNTVEDPPRPNEGPASPEYLKNFQASLPSTTIYHHEYPDPDIEINPPFIYFDNKVRGT
jgi:hypothetical protein